VTRLCSLETLQGEEFEWLVIRAGHPWCVWSGGQAPGGERLHRNLKRSAILLLRQGRKYFAALEYGDAYAMAC